MRAAELEAQMRTRDWAAIEQLSLLWRQGHIPPERALEIISLILPEPVPEEHTPGPRFHGTCMAGSADLPPQE